jgi:hypothetical protein
MTKKAIIKVNTDFIDTKPIRSALSAFVVDAETEKAAVEAHQEVAKKVRSENRRGGRPKAFATPVVKVAVFLPAEVAAKLRGKAGFQGKTISQVMAALIETL